MPAWPFEQAALIQQRLGDHQGPVAFSTGYGPSGAPHIGTFGEVVRTNMVRRAFEQRTEGRYETRLLVVSDDYDAMRRVPDGEPAWLNEYLGHPLSRVPDPSGVHSSYAGRNNAALRAFIDSLGIDYEFVSSTTRYQGGQYNDALLNVCRHYDAIMAVMLPTLGEERRLTYSPFLPVSPATGQLLQVPVEIVNAGRGQISFIDVDGRRVETDVLDGRTKLQWKVDWAMRWGALGVNYEMCGKDLTDSYRVSSRIARILGHEPPVNMIYELFLDGQGEKISKSRGNGLTLEQWDRYGTREALAYYMFQSPRSAKRLHVDVIGRAQDDYLKALSTYAGQSPEQRLDNPVWHVHGGSPPSWSSDVSYSLLVNLTAASATTDEATIRGMLDQYRSITEVDRPIIEEMIPRVLAYCRDVVFPARRLREPTQQEREGLMDLAERLSAMADGLDGEAYQFEVYEVGKAHGFAENLRAWFQALYEVLMGNSQGPRFGTFIAAYGRERTIELLRSVL